MDANSTGASQGPLLVGALGLAFAISIPLAHANADDRTPLIAAPVAVPQAMQANISPPATQPARDRSSRTQILSHIERTASRYGVEQALVRAIVAAESAYNCRAVSRVGALGLMQLMPSTAADYGVNRSEDLFDPAINIDTGVRHLKRLLDKYANDYGRVIMAYNAGEGAVDRSGGHLTYAETLAYTESVIRHYRTYGGVRPMDAVLQKVSALRRLRGQGSSALAGMPSGKSAKRTLAERRRASACCSDLAEGELDRALRTDRTDGDFGGLL